MPLDEASRRFAFTMQRELRRLTERDEARGDAVRFDPISRIVARSGGAGEPFRFFGERLAVYGPRDRILRWAWAGALTHASHVEVVFREGQARGVPQLAQSIVGDLGENEAMLLVRLGALVANAEGVHVERRGDEVEMIGLFERTRPADASSRISVPPAAPRRPSPSPKYVAHRSMPPIGVTEIYEPRGSRPPPPAAKIREPGRALFFPVAEAVLATLDASAAGYAQALFVLTVNADPSGKRRLIVGVVVLGNDGLLRALDPSSELVERAAAFVDADQRDGNGPWRKLSARVTPKADGGATLHVDVL